MNRRNVIRLLGGGCVVAAGGAGAYVWADRALFRVPRSATAAWLTAGTFPDVRHNVLSYAILAPNPHNLQPWMADLSVPGEISIALDPKRLLPATDPFGRQILMGLGAFLELLSLAALQRGHQAATDLFPDGEPGEHLDGRRVARITLTQNAAVRPDPFFAHVLSRRTDRRPYDPALPVTAREVAVLEAAVAPLKLAFGVESKPNRLEVIHDIVRRAWRAEITTPATMMESVRVLRVGAREIDQQPILANDSVSTSFNNFSINSIFNDKQLYLVGFVSDATTREVLQVEKVKIR